MSIPAGRTRRTRIQWHDDGSSQRVRGFFSEDVSPFRALGLAAVLGVISIAAVVSVIQFQRHGGFGDVGSSLVEEAQASSEPRTAAAETPAAQPAPAPAIKAVEAGAAATPAPVRQPQAAKADSPTTALALGESRGLVLAASANETMSASNAGLDAVEAIQADELQRQALEPLTTNDPRWQAVETASIGAKQRDVTADDKPAVGALAFAPVEEAAPLPEPAPRKKATVVTAIEAKPQPASAVVGATANARVRSSVFLRSRPADGSKVLVTIPGGSNIQVAAGCRHWCAVTYQGRSGFIYKSFLSR